MNKTTEELKEAIKNHADTGTHALARRMKTWNWRTQTGKTVTPGYISVLKTQLRKTEPKPVQCTEKEFDVFDCLRAIHNMDVPVKYKIIMYTAVNNLLGGSNV